MTEESLQSRLEEGETLPSPPNPIAIRMGMWLFLSSIGVFFIASIIGIVIIRNSSPNWGENAPPIPDLAWVSTGVILLISVFSQLGLSSVREDSLRLFKACMWLVLILGFVFLFLQEQVWQQMLSGGDGSFNASSSLHGWTIYALGLIHALHLAGGLVFQAYVTSYATRGGYWSLHHITVQQVTLYWHFLGGVWVGLFAFLLWLA
ncbi:MAG: hypothetical protein GWP41_09440 [Planctomycetia bacterium]|nr:hypothetical protein [Planctomycetia bacterium]NCG12783.1 hypothetical protein [Planctomycetia bacterium]NCG56257.1 hypothetical protein [Pseudomonadota bacterium]